jgi:hygromycin-B 4-O-kinase
MSTAAGSTRPAGPVALAGATAFLGQRYGGRARAVAPLGGGDWSRAFAFRLGADELVARFGRWRDDFVKDREAQAFGGPDLPVPEFLELGPALDGYYAISRRHHGVFLEELDQARLRRLLPALLRGLDALRELPPSRAAGMPAEFADPAAPDAWRTWMTALMEDRPGERVSGWRRVLAADPELDGLYTAAEREVRARLGDLPELRHVLHGDLLNRNVLVTPDGSALTAVFDWGCCDLGDFVYEVAWFTFWAPWFPGLAAIGFAAEARAHYARLGLAVPGFATRLRCYELHIGLRHLAYCAFVGPSRAADLAGVAHRTRQVLASPA